MRRIAISGPLPAPGTTGGVATHTEHLAAELRRSGRDVLVLSDSHVRAASSRGTAGVRGCSASEALALSLAHPLNGAAIAARAGRSEARRRLGVPYATAFARSLLLGAATREFKAEVLHVQQADFRPLYADWAGIRAPRVITVHGLGALDAGAYPALRDIIPANLARADVVVTPSQALADEVAALGVPAERVRVIPNGVDHAIFHPRDRAASRNALGIDPGLPLVVYVGRLTRAKGVEDLLQAWELLRAEAPETTLALIGPADEDLAVPADRLLLPGALSPADAALWLGAADVAAVPSRYEGFGLSALEAMASARAVVATRVGGLAEIVPPAAGALVPAAEPAALASALGTLLGDPAEADASGARGAAAAASYSWSSTAVAYGALYDSL